MYIEKYESNPAANAFSYQHVVLGKPMRVTQVFVANSITNSAYHLCIYRGTISAWSLNNHEFLMWIYYTGWHTAVGTVQNNQCLVNFVLPPGSYTFACYAVTDVANLKWGYHLEPLS